MEKTWWGRQRWLLVAGLSLWCPVPRINEIIENLQRKSLIFLDFSKNFFHLDNTGDDVENPKAFKIPQKYLPQDLVPFPIPQPSHFQSCTSVTGFKHNYDYYSSMFKVQIDNIPFIHDWALINDGRAKNKSPILRRRAGLRVFTWGWFVAVEGIEGICNVATTALDSNRSP